MHNMTKVVKATLIVSQSIASSFLQVTENHKTLDGFILSLDYTTDCRKLSLSLKN